MVSFLAASEEDAVGSSRGRTIWKLAESLGGVESMIEVPTLMTHASTADAPFAAPPNLVRLSVGIESVDDLVADLEQALVRSLHVRDAGSPPLARVGLVAKGVSFAIVGVLALELALGRGGKSTSRQGALATLADESYGKSLLVALAAGFAAYGLWRVAQAFFEREEEDQKLWAKRIGYLGRAAHLLRLDVSAR